MKIVDTNDEVLKVFRDDEDYIWLEFEDKAFPFTPLEARELGLLLREIANQTDYFQGLNAGDRA